MKSRGCSHRFFFQYRPWPKPGHLVASHIYSAPGKGYAGQQRNLLLGLSVLLILCWTIASIWLISVRQGERSRVEGGERRGTIVARGATGMVPGS